MWDQRQRLNLAAGGEGGGDPTARPATHRIAANDHLAMLAVRYGYRTWKTIWDANPELQAKRSHPFCLFHGDRIVPKGDLVKLPPDETTQDTGSTEATHSFVVPTSELWLRLQILDEAFMPLKQAPYKMVIDGIWYEGKTDDLGRIEVQILPGAQVGAIEITATSVEPTGELTGGGKVMFPLQIGRLDPILEQAPDKWCIAGVQARLNNLGFESGPVDGIRGPITTGAVKRFQKRVGITVDGLPGPITQGKLNELHDTDSTAWPALVAPGVGETGTTSAPLESGVVATTPTQDQAPAAPTQPLQGEPKTLVAGRSFEGYGYGSGPNQLVCTTYCVEVLKKAGYIINSETAKTINIATINSGENLSQLVNAGDPRTKGVVQALLESAQGQEVSLDALQKGDFVQYWYQTGSGIAGHSGQVAEVHGNGIIDLHSSNHSTNGVGLLKNLNLKTKIKAYAVRPKNNTPVETTGP